MGKIKILGDVIGSIKDRVSQSKAILIPLNAKSQSLHLSLLRATNHDRRIAPENDQIARLLSAGYGSRATAGSAVETVMDRLQKTRDAVVAVKCLIIVHYLVKRGSFILQDQLSVYPSAGGRNHLKLSDFRDEKSAFSWQLSSWVRWYALYLEHLLSASRVVGFFIGSTSRTTTETDTDRENVSSLSNNYLLEEIEAFTSLLEQACRIPDSNTLVQGENLVHEVARLVGEDYNSAVNELRFRVCEFKERLGCLTLSFSDSVELVCALRRLEGCKGKPMEKRWDLKRGLVEEFWCLVGEVKCMVGNNNIAYGHNGKMLVSLQGEEKSSLSARFSDQVVPGLANSVRFSSISLSIRPSLSVL